MFTKQFNQLTKKDIPIAGGKGASLGEMTKAGISVPPGFVILASAFDRFLAESDLGVEIEAISKKIKLNDLNTVEKASEEIRDLVTDVEFPDDIAKEILKEYESLAKVGSNPKTTALVEPMMVAVRSSATAEDSSIASWAGELDSYLNVSEKNLLESVKKCWSSLFTPRAIFYRVEKKLHKTPVSVAVVIQKMVQAEVSGICFTVHPVTKDYTQMVIEAGYGLGEAVVGGMITPDTYIINKSKIKPAGKKLKTETLKNKVRKAGTIIIDKNISEQEIMIIRSSKGTKQVKVASNRRNQQKINDKVIIELAQHCINIEKHYKKPQDIEWVMEKGKILIVQSRPITTL